MTSDQTPPTSGAQAVRGGVPDDEISLWEVLSVLLRRRRVIILSTLGLGALAVAFALLRAASFTTAASFRPQGSEAPQSQLVALASQFGMAIGGGDELSPAFYEELLTSREILLTAAESGYDVDGSSVRLPDLLEIREETADLRSNEVVEWLRESALSVRTGRATGIVTFAVTTDWPALSFQIADRLLAEVSRFNLETRQSQAASERAFIEGRVENARDDLQAAEDELQQFLQANRQFENSPELRFQYERLQRNVSLQQQVYTTLVQSFEQARIAEVRDTPVLTVLQPPFMPPGPDERQLTLFLALGLALGGMGGIVLAFVVEAFTRPAGNDPAREDFRRTLDGLLASFGLGRRARDAADG